MSQNIKKPATKSTHPKGGVSTFADTFVQAESSVLRINCSAKNPVLSLAANRYLLLQQITNK
ncbi:MAG: hypothetical protein EOM90_08960 [Alphaproteobacteria bacterium]|nr:hypothetical protein [Alphaproteobacteria bacterium]